MKITDHFAQIVKLAEKLIPENEIHELVVKASHSNDELFINNLIFYGNLSDADIKRLFKRLIKISVDYKIPINSLVALDKFKLLREIYCEEFITKNIDKVYLFNNSLIREIKQGLDKISNEENIGLFLEDTDYDLAQNISKIINNDFNISNARIGLDGIEILKTIQVYRINDEKYNEKVLKC